MIKGYNVYKNDVFIKFIDGRSRRAMQEFVNSFRSGHIFQNGVAHSQLNRPILIRQHLNGNTQRVLAFISNFGPL